MQKPNRTTLSNIAPMMTYYPREIANQLANALDDMPAVAVTGMRQTGNSTFLQEQAELKGRKYVTLDEITRGGMPG